MWLYLEWGLCKSSEVEMRSVGWTLNPIWLDVLTKKKWIEQSHTWKMAMWRWRWRLELCCHKWRKLAATRSGKKHGKFLPRSFWRWMALLIPGFWISSLLNCGKINFCLPSLCYFVIPALWNKFIRSIF